MSDAYLVLTSDDKYGVIEPRVIGPFSSQLEAEEFQRLDPYWDDEDGIRWPVDGGYAGSTIVCTENAESPDTVRAEWNEWDDE